MKLDDPMAKDRVHFSKEVAEAVALVVLKCEKFFWDGISRSRGSRARDGNTSRRKIGGGKRKERSSGSAETRKRSFVGSRRRPGAACPVRRFASRSSVTCRSGKAPNEVRCSFWTPVKAGDLAASVGIQGRAAHDRGGREAKRTGSVKRRLDRFRSRGRRGEVSSGRLRSSSDDVEREMFSRTDGSKKPRGNKFTPHKPAVRLGLRQKYLT